MLDENFDLIGENEEIEIISETSQKNIDKLSAELVGRIYLEVEKKKQQRNIAEQSNSVIVSN